MRDIARHRREDGLRFAKGMLEVRAFARAEVEERYFEDHLGVSFAVAERVLYASRFEECRQFLKHFIQCRWRQFANEFGLSGFPIEALDLIGQNRSADF
jgi:hypothetical protein